MESKHTPGPWRIEPASHGFRAPDGKDVAVVGSNDVCPGIVWDFGDEGRANAALIAAAPDLLEACKAALFNEGGWPEWQEQVRAAIARAEGR